MSELKAYYCHLLHDEYTEFYSKSEADKEIKRLKRALWFMTAEWADAMGLASCNIASKFMSRENFEVSDDYRNKTIKKYRHRQVVFCKYADYCRQKAEQFKETK
jgi:hypothetical protein